MLDSVIRVNKKYYPQTLLEEGKYKMENLINPYLDLSSSDESDNESNNALLGFYLCQSRGHQTCLQYKNLTLFC